MAISKVGSADAAAAIVALPAFTPGDLAILFAFNANAATNPTAVAGWTVYSNGAANVTGFQVAYRVLQAGDVDTGTWTNATHIEVIVLSGAAVADTSPLGPAGLSSTGTTSTPSWPALTLSDNGGRNWLVLFGGHRSATNMNSVALGSTTNESPSSGALAMHTVRGGISAWSATSKTVNAALGWRTYGVEVKVAGLGDRVTQIPAEELIRPDPPGRQSQEPVESVIHPVPFARESQEPVESLVRGESRARESQEPVEALLFPENRGRQSQEPVEAVVIPSSTLARGSQEPAEALLLPVPNAGLSQYPVEILIPNHFDEVRIIWIEEK